MNWLAVTSLREYWCSIENKQWPEWTQVCKNNTPEKAVALLGSINKELAAILKTKLCVDATGATL